jgi:two-component system, chemotaxis family, sensor kinase CheA
MDEDAEFLKDLMETFLQETEEHIRVLSGAVVELEAAGETSAVQGPVEILFREAHSLKGAAGAVGLPTIVSICQAVESVLAKLKRRSLQATPAVVDAISEFVDCLQACVLTGDGGSEQRATALVERLNSLSETSRERAADEPIKIIVPGLSGGNGGMKPAVRQFDSPARPEPVKTQPATTVPVREPAQPASATSVETPVAATDTVRVSTGKLESLMLQAEEFISIKLATAQRSSALRDINSRLDIWKREWYQARISGDHEKITEFLDWNSTFMEGLGADIRTLSKSTEEETRTVGPMVDELVDGMKRVLMLPVASLLSSFPKMVRDLARSRGKQAELTITGADIEIDKRVIENLKDPLTHILRNAVDHGIEAPEARQNLGKSVRGRILIAVTQLENNKIQLCVSDDGSGIDVRQLREAAVRDGLRTQGQLEATDDAEALRLVFASGLSTSTVVSQVSGRGLGMAIVEEKVDYLGGSVTVDTEMGKGTMFRITVPATLATTRGILAQVSDWPFVMPVVSVDRVVRVRKGDIRMVENRETIQLEGHTLPLVYLHEVLDLPLKPQRNVSDYIQAVVAGGGDDRVAFAVDRILGEQEVLVKTLGPQLVRVRNIAGGTIIGSGKVVPIMNIADLLQSAAASARQGRRSDATGANGSETRKAVLVVEDSITSRMLLKNVLEAAGYYVKPTVDGVDALSALREEDFDLVISDIEMPRMDGFELTSKIRGDARLSRTPVMLVTGMETQEQKEKGIDVGANAYLTKSSFTQGTLLETARSLL